MVFDDDFEGSSLDKTKWNSTYNWGHTHNHRAYCVEENVSVSNGCLVLNGEASVIRSSATCSSGGKTIRWTIPQRYRYPWTFRCETRLLKAVSKMPSQLGTWPAFWMLQDGWPPEIDIFEVPHARTDHHYICIIRNHMV
jgi:beta-glucanase (GH16 family)